MSLPEIARQLAVDYVVDGSVRRGGDRVRISVHLVSAADGFPMWSDTFERELRDAARPAGYASRASDCKPSHSPSPGNRAIV